MPKKKPPDKVAKGGRDFVTRPVFISRIGAWAWKVTGSEAWVYEVAQRVGVCSVLAEVQSLIPSRDTRWCPHPPAAPSPVDLVSSFGFHWYLRPCACTRKYKNIIKINVSSKPEVNNKDLISMRDHSQKHSEMKDTCRTTSLQWSPRTKSQWCFLFHISYLRKLENREAGEQKMQQEIVIMPFFVFSSFPIVF